MQKFDVSILGFGTVGAGVYKILTGNHDDIAHREDLDLRIRKILVRDFEHEPNLGLADMSYFTTDFSEIVSDPDTRIIVECIGGVEPARTYILKALDAGKTVVTSNKEVISKHWPEFEAAAKNTGAGLYMEATVGGGIPILKTIIDSMQANNIERIMGIINGTTNYILTNMAESGVSFSEALSQAQKLGYAEANPTADIEGFDATYKLSILSSMSFHAHMPVDVIYREGITRLSSEDFDFAKKLGYEIKLLAIGKKNGNNIEVRVHPTMLPKTHPLAAVRGVFNAIFVTGHAVGDIMLYGQGAGQMPTASAVVSDVIYACHSDGHHKYMTFRNEEKMTDEVNLVENFRCRYCIRVNVVDEPGTMAAISEVFAKHNVSLKDVLQLGAPDNGVSSRITFMTHEANEFDIRSALSDIGKLTCVHAIESMIRAEA
ncbi:MAG: homoserine dehydrogenase [Clostridia bacterium]|nr:homoserine dehydrogenase [Clostridia bacterium]MBR0445522.1 homoserine dehydrogenase [Clostridia bacterium]